MSGSHDGIVAYWNSHRVRYDGFSATRVQKVVILRAKRRVHGTVAGCRLGLFFFNKVRVTQMVGRTATCGIVKKKSIVDKIDLTATPRPCHVRAVLPSK